MSLLTILQLDTSFVRIPGDVACPATYDCRVEILTIPAATVAAVVTKDPAAMDISAFDAAMMAAKGDVIVTSCGFLCHWQDHLAALTDRPFISSALVGLPALIPRYAADRLGIFTYDSTVLNAPAYGRALTGFNGPIIGLPETSHLRDVISRNLPHLNQSLVNQEIGDIIDQHKAMTTLDGLVLECTNLPPYKAELRSRFGFEVYDILSLIEAACPGMVAAEFR